MSHGYNTLAGKHESDIKFEIHKVRQIVKYIFEKYNDISTMYIRVTVYWGYLIVLWLLNVVCILWYDCFNLFCNVWVWIL